jgi:glycosyltransferase involved in cell wall biosynthesis
LPEPTVTAIVLAYNEERYIAEAIESVLVQTHRCDQVLVVDNGSGDRSREIAASYAPEVTVLLEPRQGIGFARNAGLETAHGDYLAFLDGDDTWEPRKTELQLAACEREPRPDLVFGHVRQFVSPELDPALAARLQLPVGPQPGMYLGAMLAPRSTWERVGPWEQGWDAADGLAWFVRARSLGLREAMLPEVVSSRRIHGANQSFRNHDQRGEWARLLKASLDERRAKGDV